ncbi:3-oxo-tetronate kinase [Aquamicrobium ahrensii]|uniref:3-oxo-tetronate kinase n=1 Tax=Aquamicrobium ahrensii TaxID=469551 RepID=UPI00339AD597
MLLGAVADDLTGATDLALTLAREGMRTVQVIGVPPADFDFGDAEAVVLALKSRTIPASEAVTISRAAARRLLDAGAEQIVFKYCSTFDSTPAGNIGQVTEALLELLDAPLTIACPAFPTNGRAVYRGHLFVGDTLLSDSPMKDHPLTPMDDANLVRVLQRQTTLPVGLVSHDAVKEGSAAISSAFQAAIAGGEKIMIVDALDDNHLRQIGRAASGMKLITGGSGIALGLPENFRRAGKIGEKKAEWAFSATDGRAVILAGSCSAATRRQIDQAMRAEVPALKINPLLVAKGVVTAESVADWVKTSNHPTPIVYSSADPSEVIDIQKELGRENAGALVEDLLAEVAGRLKQDNFTRFLVAGGETSGAVVQALGVSALQIGPEIDPGVPWTRSVGEERPIALALKSGNFGADDFFLKAWSRIQ